MADSISNINVPFDCETVVIKLQLLLNSQSSGAP